MTAQASPFPKNWQGNFFTLWSGQAASLFGSPLVQFALVWWLTATTGSATVLAIASLLAMLPNVLLGPVADTFGMQFWYVAGSLVCAVMGVIAYFIPALRNLEDHRAEPVAAPATS